MEKSYKAVNDNVIPDKTRLLVTYKSDVLKKAIQNFQPLMDRNMATGELIEIGDWIRDENSLSNTINLNRTSHEVKKLYIEDGALVCEFRILNTPSGTKLSTFMNSGELDISIVKPTLRAKSSLHNGIVQDDLKIITVDFIYFEK